MITFVLLAAPCLVAIACAVYLARTTKLKTAARLEWPAVFGLGLAAMLLPILARMPFALALGHGALPIWSGAYELWMVHALPVALTVTVARIYGRATPRVAVATALGALGLPLVFHAACPFVEGSSDSAMGIALLFGFVYFATLITGPLAFAGSVLFGYARRS